MVSIRTLKKGDFFKRNATTSIVYVLDGYDRSSRKYYAYKWDDVNDGRLFKGDTQVFVDFTF